jgi:hypothetical protein
MATRFTETFASNLVRSLEDAMNEGTGKIAYQHALRMWWLLLWRSLLAVLLFGYISYMLLMMEDNGSSQTSLNFWSRAVAGVELIGTLLLTVFAIQLLVQQMIRKRYRAFSLSVMDEPTQGSRSRSHLTIPERFKVVAALFWRIAPIIALSFSLTVGPNYVGLSPLASLLNIASLALLIFAPPFGVRAALGKRYSTFEVRLASRAE